MNQIVQDHDAKLTEAAGKPDADPHLVTLSTDWTKAKGAWDQAYGDAKNAQANYSGGTVSLENLLLTLKSSPGIDQESKIENWERRIRNEAPKGSALYTTLLPQGRAPFTSGKRDNIINEVKNLGLRLNAQTGNPNLVALGGEVTAFYGELNKARDAPQGMEGDNDSDSTAIEAARLAVACELYGNMGMLMYIYRANPEQVANFFDLQAVRKSGSSDNGTPPVTPPAP